MCWRARERSTLPLTAITKLKYITRCGCCCRQRLTYLRRLLFLYLFIPMFFIIFNMYLGEHVGLFPSSVPPRTPYLNIFFPCSADFLHSAVTFRMGVTNVECSFHGRLRSSCKTLFQIFF